MLYQRIGSKLFTHIILHTSIFKRLKNNNYEQICGRNIYSLNQNIKVKIYSYCI